MRFRAKRSFNRSGVLPIGKTVHAIAWGKVSTTFRKDRNMDQIPLVILSWIIMMSPQGNGGGGGMFSTIIMLGIIVLVVYLYRKYGKSRLRWMGSFSAPSGGGSLVSSGVSSGTVRLDDQKIKQRWGQIIEGGNGKTDVIYKLTQEFL